MRPLALALNFHVKFEDYVIYLIKSPILKEPFSAIPRPCSQKYH